eukprot:194544_1
MALFKVFDTWYIFNTCFENTNHRILRLPVHTEFNGNVTSVRIRMSIVCHAYTCAICVHMCHLRGDHITIDDEGSASKVLCAYLNKNHGISLDGKKSKRFIYVPAKDVPPRYSNIQRLQVGTRGVTDFHCSRADTNGTLWFRPYSCFCDDCHKSRFRSKCSHSDRVGKWIQCERIKKKVPPKPRAKYEYDHNDKLKELFGSTNLNKLLVKDLKTLCKRYNQTIGGIKIQLVQRLVEYGLQTITINTIPSQYKHHQFWKYCNDLHSSSIERIVHILSGKATRGTDEIEDIVLVSYRTADQSTSTSQKVFRMFWREQRWKIITLTPRKRPRHN